jgi:hypothetical protein
VQFASDLVVFEVLRELETRLGVQTPQEYGLFLPEEESVRGRWLEPGRTLDYYDLHTGVGRCGETRVCVRAVLTHSRGCQDLLEYKKKVRPLRVRLMDGSLRTVCLCTNTHAPIRSTHTSMHTG